MKIKKPITIHPYKGPQDLAEIYQSMEVKMSLLKPRKDGSFDQVSAEVLCRDFLADIYTSSVQKYDFEIYGCAWNGKKDEPNWDAVYLKLNFPTQDEDGNEVTAQEDFKKNIKLLHDIEKKNGIPLTRYYDVEGQIGIIIGNKRWLKTSLYISLYTFLLRCFCYKFKTKNWIKELSEQGYTDSEYIASIDRKTLNKVLNDLKSIDTKEFCGLDHKEHGTDGIHHNSGFISVFGEHSEMDEETVRENKHWKIMQKRGFVLYTQPYNDN